MFRGEALGCPGTNATILKEPAAWRFERMPVFTYVPAVSAEGAPELDAAGLKDFLEKYHRGSSVGLGRRKGLSPTRRG